MKVAVTGHTAGLGRALAEAFRARGDQVLGLELPAGDPDQRERLARAAADCDLFVNARADGPAGRGEGQLQLLFLLARLWQGLDKTIVNLGSREGERRDPAPNGGPAGAPVYQRALDAACQQLFNRGDQRPRVVNVRPGPVEGESPCDLGGPALDPGDVARAVFWVLEQPPHVHVASVTLSRWEPVAEQRA